LLGPDIAASQQPARAQSSSFDPAVTSLAVVIVSFNTRDLLDACLTALSADVHATEIDGQPIHAATWVVDNASADGSADMVAMRHPQVHVLALDTNLGFTAANNLVLDRWVEHPDVNLDPSAAKFAPDRRPDFVLLLNPDTEIQPGAIAALIRALQAAPDAAVAGPRLAYGDGRFQHGAFRFPGIIQTWLDLFPVARLSESRLNGRYPRAIYERGRPFGVDFVLGACMLVRGTALGAVGPLDTGFFMYCEEIDWCRRFRAAGWRTLCVPAALVVHHAGASTRQFRGPTFTALWRSRRRYFAKHAPRGKRVIIDAIIRLGLTVHRNEP
jgi:N-acetylglucosaminyl-diphospho-decaprenol L-rhamnosyltransferase